MANRKDKPAATPPKGGGKSRNPVVGDRQKRRGGGNNSGHRGQRNRGSQNGSQVRTRGKTHNISCAGSGCQTTMRASVANAVSLGRIKFCSRQLQGELKSANGPLKTVIRREISNYAGLRREFTPGKPEELKGLCEACATALRDRIMDPHITMPWMDLQELLQRHGVNRVPMTGFDNVDITRSRRQAQQKSRQKVMEPVVHAASPPPKATKPSSTSATPAQPTKPKRETGPALSELFDLSSIGSGPNDGNATLGDLFKAAQPRAK